MPEQLIRKSLELTPDQWRQLDEMAGQLQTLAKGGPGHNRPSWRILVRQIADHQLTVTPKEQTQ